MPIRVPAPDRPTSIRRSSTGRPRPRGSDPPLDRAFDAPGARNARHSARPSEAKLVRSCSPSSAPESRRDRDARGLFGDPDRPRPRRRRAPLVHRIRPEARRGSAENLSIAALLRRLPSSRGRPRRSSVARKARRSTPSSSTPTRQLRRLRPMAARNLRKGGLLLGDTVPLRTAARKVLRSGRDAPLHEEAALLFDTVCIPTPRRPPRRPQAMSARRRGVTSVIVLAFSRSGSRRSRRVVTVSWQSRWSRACPDHDAGRRAAADRRNGEAPAR